jgi:hypothetical protein
MFFDVDLDLLIDPLTNKLNSSMQTIVKYTQIFPKQNLILQV